MVRPTAPMNPMNLRTLGTLAASLGLPLAFSGATPATPPTEEWPMIEPAVVIADGFQSTGWAEYQWRNDAWEPTRRQERSHDGQGRLTTIREESWFMDKWQVSNVETMSYDEADRLVEKIRQEAVGNSLHNRGRHTYEHRPDNTITVDLAAWSQEQRWLPLSQEILLFDDAGRLVEHTTQSRQGNLTRGQFFVRHHYDAAGRRTQLLRQRDQGGRWVDAERVDYIHDEAGRLKEAAWVVMGRGQWTPGVQITHEYDAAGRRSISNRHTRGPNDGFEVASRLVHGYDEDGNEVERVSQQLRDGVWIDARKETYSVRPLP